MLLRCIPCEECVKLDDEIIDKHPRVRPLLDKFVCVRIVSTNGLDLSLFQYDTDQGTYYTLGSPLQNEFASMTAVKLPVPIDANHQNFGQSFDFLIGSNDAVCPLELIGFEGIFKSRPVN